MIFLNPVAWVHGLASAFITGGASAAAAMVIKPEDFNFTNGLSDLAKLFVAAGVVGALAYLKNSPLPAIREAAEEAKRDALGLILAGALLVGATGCATTGGGGTTVQDIAPAVKVAAFSGTWYAVKEHPDWRDEFEIAAADLLILERLETIDFPALMSIVARLPVKELQSDDAKLAITAASMLLSSYGNRLVELDKLENLRPIVAALREGIELGLSGRQ